MLSRRNFLKSMLGIFSISYFETSKDIKNLPQDDPESFKFSKNVANKRNWEVYSKVVKEGHILCEYAVLFDVSKCIGCRRCEWACNDWNNNPNQPIELFERSRFESPSVFDKVRRPSAGNFTVVNRFIVDGKPYYIKTQCMHCKDPACVSACFVGALVKTKQGPVLYNPELCVGCRYCMIACPFDIPAYEYYDPLTPEITKCTMCFDRIVEGKAPACVTVCSTEALKFGKKEEILEYAYKIIKADPQSYIQKVYGEKEFGGTNWLYISPVPLETLGFPKGLMTSPANYTRNFLFTVKVLEVLFAPALVYLAYRSLKKKEGAQDE